MCSFSPCDLFAIPLLWREGLQKVRAHMIVVFLGIIRRDVVVPDCFPDWFRLETEYLCYVCGAPPTMRVDNPADGASLAV
jgi:hypothetical protein